MNKQTEVPHTLLDQLWKKYLQQTPAPSVGKDLAPANPPMPSAASTPMHSPLRPGS